MLWYLLKVIICSGILTGYYWLVLRNKIFHQYNRFYLLATMVLSLTLPMLQFHIGHAPEQQQGNVIQALRVVSAGDEYLENVIITNTREHWNLQQMVPFLYLLISLAFFVLLIHSLFSIFLLIKKYPVQQIENISFINTDNARGTPYSFFKYIFWNKAIDMQTTEGKQIFKHELAHITEKHTYDKLFMNGVLIFCWCNPFFWLIRKELNTIHEFIADKKAVDDLDTASFAAMILQASYPQHRFQIANPFFYSSIKRRLRMLTKDQNPKVNYFGRLLVLPLAVIIFAVFSFKIKDNGNIYHGKKITVVIDAGHGGEDAGARSKNGILEKDLTLLLAKKVKALNDNNDIEIILTREEDVYMSPKEKADFANNKNADLLISFHIDSDPALNQKSGMSFFVAKEQFPNTKESKVFARSLINEFSNNYSLPVVTDITQRNLGIWILQASHAPAVLIDAGYINNATDLAYLQTDAGQETIAKNVLSAIEKYLSQPTANIAVNDTVPTKLPTPEQWDKAASTASANGHISLKGSGNALFVVDGVVMDKNFNVDKINPNDILRIDVLKDKAATEKYGDAGKNGVIIITTKKQGALSEIAVTGYALKSTENDLDPVKVTGYPLKNTTGLSPIKVTGQPLDLTSKAIISLDKMNMLYIGLDNPLTVSAPGVDPKDLRLTISQGSISGSNGKYTAHVTIPGTAIINVFKTGDNKPLQSFEYRVKRVPDPVNGKVAIDYDVNISQRPQFYYGDITGVRPELNLFKKQTEVRVSGGYEFVSAQVYFSGVGFPNVVTTFLNSTSLSSLRNFIDKCEAGTAITFDNIRVRDKEGNVRTMDGISYAPYVSVNTDDRNVIFTKTEEEAKFSDDPGAWKAYLMKNLNSNSAVDEGWKKGTHQVIIQFIVYKDGSIGDVKALTYAGSKTAQHCIDIIQKGPKWVPAIQNGRSVNAYRKQPITFVISEQ